MKRERQADSNPFPYSDSNKRYYTYDYYLRQTYGEKCAKISLDAGLSCPNIDGTCGYGGCIYCSPAGSGDFTQGASLTIREQYERQIALMTAKWPCRFFIPYLQAHTNTYAPVSRLREIYEETLSLSGAVALHIATRADCLPDDVLSLLAETAEKIDLTVELGLQSIHDRTAQAIGRGHTYADFCRGFSDLRSASKKIRIAVHLINGLPEEDQSMMLESAVAVGELHPEQIKFHLLHVLRHTRMAALLESGRYEPMSEDAYVSTLVRQLERTPDDIVIGRVTGDGAKADLLAPLWSLKKFCVMNHLDRMLFEENTWQGKRTHSP